MKLYFLPFLEKAEKGVLDLLCNLTLWSLGMTSIRGGNNTTQDYTPSILT